HNPYEELVGDLQTVIDRHKLWGCPYVGLGSMPKQWRHSKEGVLTFAREATEIGKRLLDHGLRLIYHNHSFEFAKLDGMSAMNWLLQETDRGALHFEVDVFWVQAAGADPADWIKRLNGRLKVVHFKDMAVNTHKERLFAEVGEGNLNWPRIIEACREVG